MRLHMLGVNGPFPESNGATSGYLLEAGDAMLLLDAGSGVLGRLTARTAPESLDAILLSHWHFDHTSDLLALHYRLDTVCARLPVYAPADESSALRKIVAACADYEVKDVAPGDCFSLGGAEIRVGEVRHPGGGVCYRISQGGRVFAYPGDTNTLSSLADFCRGCHLLLADGLFPEEAWAEGKPHLSARLAAELARDAEAERLILTHLNPLYPPLTLLREAQAVFPRVTLARAGDSVDV